jgi:hypothetical protein
LIAPLRSLSKPRAVGPQDPKYLLPNLNNRARVRASFNWFF